jgi:membrane-associated protease RseP (regulator of RpoE activity)
MKRIIAISFLTLACAATASMAKEPASASHVIRVKDVKAVAKGKEVRYIKLRDGDIYVNGDPVKRGFLGVQLMQLTEDLRKHFGAPKESGVLVSAVTADGPAAKAGLEVGDVITAIDGKAAASVLVVERLIREKKDGDRVQIEVVRNRGPRTLSASITQREARIMDLSSLENLPMLIDGEKFRADLKLNERLNTPEFRERLLKLNDCTSVQSRLKDLEKRLADLEKKKE